MFTKNILKIVLCLSRTIWSLVFIVFILIIIDVYFIRIGLFGKFCQLTARSVTPA